MGLYSGQNIMEGQAQSYRPPVSPSIQVKKRIFVLNKPIPLPGLIVAGGIVFDVMAVI